MLVLIGQIQTMQWVESSRPILAGDGSMLTGHKHLVQRREENDVKEKDRRPLRGPHSIIRHRIMALIIIPRWQGLIYRLVGE